MGWVSCLEDITERLDEDLRLVSDALESEGAKTVERQRLQALIAEARARTRELHSYLNLATDPEVDIARELKAAQDERARLKDKLGSVDARVSKAAKQVEKAESHSDRLKKELKDTQKKLRAAEAQLEKIFSKHPAVAYELY